ncbi:MAG: alpha-hydroxy-acid oxidizing protein, partial [Cyanobacteria bacterium REEB65]|nr:alpha-hydroxy-acid oxidizing protein [Cyanobacteria bacterium REEB65]
MPEIFNRKQEHLDICLTQDVSSQVATGFEKFRFRNRALPGCDLSQVTTWTTFLDKTLQAPLFIGPITGGTAQGREINRNLAIAAQALKIGMIVGSQRIAIEHPEVAHTFAIARAEAPDIPLGANLGAIQLVNGFGVKECLKAIRMIQADFLVLHLNALHEALQAEGETNFHHVVPRLAEVIAELPVPVVVKESGFG